MILKGELFLAWRYLKPQKSLVSLLTYTSLLGPILGVGVLIVVMSVMNGMPREFVQKLIEYNAHITLESQDPIENADDLVAYIEDKYKVKAAPVTTLHVFLQKRKGIQGFLAKGVYPEKDKDVSKLKNMINKDFMPEYKLDTGEIIISRNTHWKLGIKVGDTVVLHSPEKYRVMLEQQVEGDTDRIHVNTAQEFKVVGYYHLGMTKIDENIVIMHQDSANELLSMNWGDALQIEIALDDPYKAEEMAALLRQDPNLTGLYPVAWPDKSQGIYKRIRKEKSLMMFVLFFIMGGAAIGVAASIFSLVLQKTKEIGILKATGASPLSIVIVFLSQGAFIGTVGSILGFGGGLLVLEYRNEVAKLLGAWDQTLYHLEGVPMYLDPGDINMIFWGSIIICLVASLIPALIAACVNPVKALQSGG